MNVLILGLSKTGTTAIATAVHNALKKQAYKFWFEPTVFGLKRGKDEMWHEALCENGNVVSKCLVFPEHSLGAWANAMKVARHYSHVIWIDRDPRDRLISNNFYRWYHGHARKLDALEKQNWEEKFISTLKRVEALEANPGVMPYLDSCDEWWEPYGRLVFLKEQLNLYYSLSIQEANMEGWFRLRYQDFIEGNLNTLNQFLGIEVKNKVKVKQKRIVRTKGYDGWRDWFNDEDVRLLKPIYYHYLAAIGSDPEDWELNYPDVIDPSIGSAYMKKVHYKFSLAF